MLCCIRSQTKAQIFFFQPPFLCTAENVHRCAGQNWCYRIKSSSAPFSPCEPPSGSKETFELCSRITGDMVRPPAPCAGAACLPTKTQLCCMYFTSISTLKSTSPLPYPRLQRIALSRHAGDGSIGREAIERQI